MGVDLRIWPVVNGVYQDALHLRVVNRVHRGGLRGAEGVFERDQHHTDGWIEPVVRFEVLKTLQWAGGEVPQGLLLPGRRFVPGARTCESPPTASEQTSHRIGRQDHRSRWAYALERAPRVYLGAIPCVPALLALR